MKHQKLIMRLIFVAALLTMAQTAWADNINVATADGFGTLTDGKYTLVNGNTYTLTDNVNTAGYIYVPSGVTATIDLAGHTIDRGLTSADNNGSVIIVAGTLTITDSGTDGKIQGGYDGYAEHGFYVSGVEVQNGATFNLQGGTLVGRNQEYDYTVAVDDNGSFTMTSGKITGGWTGVLAVGNVTLTGGEISGNSNSGVRVGENISISGNPVITGNTVMNVDLVSSGQKKIIITGALTEGANIGITAPKPTDNAPVTVTSGYNTYNSVSPDTYFSLDNDGQIQTSPFDYMTVVMGWNEDRTEVAVGTALYTVNFDMNGHGDAIDAVSLLSGYKVAQPTEPTADDRFFVDWFTDDACTTGNEWNFDNAVTSNMTLHALWTQEAIYSIILPENMVIVSTTNAPVGGKYPVGTEIKFKLSSADYVVDGDVKNGDDVLTADANGIYTVTMGDADLAITATVKKAVEPNKTLSGSDNYTANDGAVLTGSTSGTVTIADNAKITLSDVTITGGIVCEGTADITLVGTNSVTGASQKAGIQVGGSGTTLTIKGNGSLTANGGGNSAGIGLSSAWDVDNTGGNIVIEGGNITATGGSMGAGIGLGVAYDNSSPRTITLGNITIKGGSVTATGGNQGKGIGTGYVYGLQNASNIEVGTITITTGIDRVEASSISESVTYKHGDTDVTSNASDYFAINGTTITLREYTITYNLNDGTNATGNPATYNLKSDAITLNNPTKDGYTFAGWTGTDLGAATTSVTIAHGSTGDRSYTATWNIITYNITYNGVEGATNPNPASYTIESEAITLDTPTKDGYTFAGWFDNAGFTGSAVMTIAAGSTGDKTFWAKWIQDLTYGGVTIKDNGTTKSATLDASQEGTISITSDVVVNAVELNRDFTANQPATVMLPFSLGTGQTVNGGSFYKFSGVTKDGDEWKALFTEVATLKANTPYLFMPSATGQVTFNMNDGTVTLNTTTTGETGSTASNWEFRGTYAKVQWDGSASDPSDLSKTYGFAKGNATIAAGQFVHFAAGAWLKPMRCYLVYNGSTEGGTFQNAPSRTRGAASTEELPQTITVVLLSSSGETTGIGTLDTKTGDITLDGWYTMDGRKLVGKPTKKGLYINNGRKIVIK